MGYNAWFLSDIHLKSNEDPKSQILIKFLESLGRQRPATHLFLLGDIFDLWLGPSDYFAQRYEGVTQAITQAQSRGIKVTYLEGNHDIHVQAYWRSKGIVCFNTDQIIHLGSQKIYLTHGDFINPAEPGYHRYIRWARGKGGLGLIHLFSAQTWWRIGQYISRTSRKRSGRRYQDFSKMAKHNFEQFVLGCQKIKSFDILVAGHIHHRLELEISAPAVSGQKIIRAYNLGSWEAEPAALSLQEVGASWEFLS